MVEPKPPQQEEVPEIGGPALDPDEHVMGMDRPAPRTPREPAPHVALLELSARLSPGRALGGCKTLADRW